MVTYWTDEKILLFSSVSLNSSQEGLISRPSSNYSLENEGFWRSIDLSEQFLIGCVTGNDYVGYRRSTIGPIPLYMFMCTDWWWQCYIFDLFGRAETTLDDCTKISLGVAEIIAVAISPNGREIACAVRRSNTTETASILHTSRAALLAPGQSSSSRNSRRFITTDWAPSDITHLTISDSCNVHVVVRPDLAMRPDEHRIPVCCISFQKGTMHTVTLESKVGLAPCFQKHFD